MPECREWNVSRVYLEVARKQAEWPVSLRIRVTERLEQRAWHRWSWTWIWLRFELNCATSHNSMTSSISFGSLEPLFYQITVNSKCESGSPHQEVWLMLSKISICHSEHQSSWLDFHQSKGLGWGDGSEVKMFPAQAWSLNMETQNPHIKALYSNPCAVRYESCDQQ